MSLGALRNIAVQHCRGEWICQWDDDDRYSTWRLELQASAAESAGAGACFLHEQLHFFIDTREMFWTDWRLLRGVEKFHPPGSCIPGTVFFRRNKIKYPEEGALAIRGEDSVLMTQLWQAGAVVVESPPGTYMRTFHGENTWHREHHLALVRTRSTNARVMEERRSELEEAAWHFGLHPPIYFMAREGLVFTLGDS